MKDLLKQVQELKITIGKWIMMCTVFGIVVGTIATAFLNSFISN